MQIAKELIRTVKTLICCLQRSAGTKKIEADKYVFDAEKKENLELLKLSNDLKRAAEKKHTELGAVLEKWKCLEEKSKHIW